MIGRLWTDWSDFWFQPAPPTRLTWFRVAVCCMSCWWFARFFPDTNAWFSADGILPGRTAALLLEYEEVARWSWSPLWLSDHAGWLTGWVVVGCLLSAVACIGLGGRWTIGVLWLWTISWAHRIGWLQGPFEPALIAALGYLIVDPGERLFTKNNELRRTAGTALRLIQVHWWILVAAGVLSQLGSIVWWRGEGAWWLASSGRSLVLSADRLVDQAVLVNLITHAMIALPLATLWLIVTRSGRVLGLAGGLLTCVGVGMIADYLMYGLLLAGWLVAFLPVFGGPQPRDRPNQPSEI